MALAASSGSTAPHTSAAQPAQEALSPEQVNAIARAVQLDLPSERVDALAHSLSTFLTGFTAVRTLDTGDREPITLVHAERERV